MAITLHNTTHIVPRLKIDTGGTCMSSTLITLIAIKCFRGASTIRLCHYAPRPVRPKRGRGVGDNELRVWPHLY